MNTDLKNEINGLIELAESRLKFLNKMYEYFIFLDRPINILETGCGSVFNNGTFACTTYIFSKMLKIIKGGSLITIDINENNINKCKQITKDFSDIIDYKLGDSIDILRNLDKNLVHSLDLIILDSFDLFLFDPYPSAVHHLQELLCLYNKIDKSKCLIAIDDNYFPGNWVQWIWSDGREEIFEVKDKLIGKGMFCHNFLLNDGWKLDDSVRSHGHNVLLYKHESNF